MPDPWFFFSSSHFKSPPMIIIFYHRRTHFNLLSFLHTLELSEYDSPKSKLSRMAKSGEYFSITKGIYETDRYTQAHLLAGSIYGPSCISFEYALSFYGMIPEAVYTVTSATFEKKKKKKFETAFGTFTYRDVLQRHFLLVSVCCKKENTFIALLK